MAQPQCPSRNANITAASHIALHFTSFAITTLRNSYSHVTLVSFTIFRSFRQTSNLQHLRHHEFHHHDTQYLCFQHSFTIHQPQSQCVRNKRPRTVWPLAPACLLSRRHSCLFLQSRTKFLFFNIPRNGGACRQAQWTLPREEVT